MQIKPVIDLLPEWPLILKDHERYAVTPINQESRQSEHIPLYTARHEALEKHCYLHRSITGTLGSPMLERRPCDHDPPICPYPRVATPEPIELGATGPAGRLG
jgi:hypothetical protein